MRLATFLVAVTVVAGVVAGVAACGEGASPAAAPATQPAPSAWVPFTSEEAGFKVLAPGALHPTPTPDTHGKFQVKAWAYTGDGVEWGIGWNRYDEVIESDYVAPLLDGGQNGMVNGFKATLKEKHDVKLGGHVGRDFTIEADAFPDIPGHVAGRVRIFIVGDQVYQMMVFHAANHALSDADQEKFFGSLELLHDVPVPNPRLADVAWHEYSDAEGKLTVLAPEKMTTAVPISATNAWDVGGTVVTLHVIGFKIPRRTSVYAVRWGDLPPAVAKLKPAAIFDSAIAEWQPRSKVTVTSRKEIPGGVELIGTAIPELKVNEANVWKAQGRMFIAGKRMYQVLLVGPQDEVELADGQRFVQSLAPSP
jgi:hypothetical protein